MYAVAREEKALKKEDAGSDKCGNFLHFFSVKNAPKNDTFGTKETTDIIITLRSKG
jgi:hypothetical protein